MILSDLVCYIIDVQCEQMEADVPKWHTGQAGWAWEVRGVKIYINELLNGLDDSNDEEKR